MTETMGNYKVKLSWKGEFTKGRVPTSKPAYERELQDIEVISTAGPAGDNMSEPHASSVATTTKHPRHRPGCSCIVCIQPPSGKGKHKPTCICNVCMTVKRRFKTLMMRKKKRQSEREAEIAAQQRNQLASSAAKEEAEVDSIPQSDHNSKRSESEHSLENTENIKGGLDLNCCPSGETTRAPTRVSMMSLLQEASLPLETYLKQNGLTSLLSDHQASSPVVGPQAQDEHVFSAVMQDHEEGSSEFSEKDQREDKPS